MKTNKLSGPALDWAVAKCEGLIEDSLHWCLYDGYMTSIGADIPFIPSTNWAQGGPIIEREIIEFVLAKDGGHHESAKWMAVIRNSYFGFGETHLIAAMRCYVASKLGDEVEIPKELA